MELSEYQREILKLAEAAAYTEQRYATFLRENREQLDGKRDSQYRILIQERDSLKASKARAADRLLQYIYTAL